jgi:serine/threonine-protein kinase
MTQIGRYDIVRKTGIHGLSVVYEAFDSKMQRPVTLRIAERRPTDPGGLAEQARDAIRSHAKLLAQLDHPNIVKVLSCEEVEDEPFLVMEQFESRPLSKLLAEGSALPPEQVIGILKSAAAGLDHAHAKGLIYGSLLPASLLLNDEGELKISGFESAGAERMSAEPPEEELDLLFESIPYMAPEVLSGEKAEARTDQFALAAVGLYAFSGAAPIPEASPVAQMQQILFAEIPFRGRFAGDRAPALAAVFERALAKLPAARYSSCTEFASAIDAAYAGGTSSLTRVAVLPVIPGADVAGRDAGYSAAGLDRRLARVAPRSLTPWILATAAIVIIAVISAFFLLRPHAPPARAVQAAPAVVPLPAAKEAPPAVPAAAQPRRASRAAGTPKKAAPERSVSVQEKKEDSEGPAEETEPTKRKRVFVTLPGQK